MTQIKLIEPELIRLDQLQRWEDNPRTYLEEDLKRLEGQIKKLGMYKPLLVNQDNVILGGDKRYMALDGLGVQEVYINRVTTNTPAQMLEYALSDNDHVGVSDDLKLAELVKLNPIEMDLFRIQGNLLRPIDSILNPTAPVVEGGEDGADQNTVDESLNQYLNGNIKQVVLYYKNEEYLPVVEKLEALGEAYGLEDNTSIVTKLIEDAYARDTPKT